MGVGQLDVVLQLHGQLLPVLSDGHTVQGPVQATPVRRVCSSRDIRGLRFHAN